MELRLDLIPILKPDLKQNKLKQELRLDVKCHAVLLRDDKYYLDMARAQKEIEDLLKLC